jgi:endonuclease/exonuclease/phosphatase family metal-dependent hydrolase
VGLFGSAALIFGAGDATCAARGGNQVRWLRAWSDDEQPAVDRWCAAVGPPVRIDGRRDQAAFTGPFALVTWNTHVGAGNLDHLVADLRSGRLSGGVPIAQFVLLLQEAYRAGSDVPTHGLAHAFLWASAQQPPRLAGTRDDIAAGARRLGLHAIYIPSMRNGAPLATNEDRGNAILSTVPLAEVTAIELPLERQRRVTIETTVPVRASNGQLVTLTLVDAHFTNMVMHHLWVLSESGRMRQARALAATLPKSGALAIGGDFNAWFGFRDAAYRELAAVAGPSPEQDRRATFGPLRLDHLLFRLPEGWKTTVRRGEQRYGSDHYPLVGTIVP